MGGCDFQPGVANPPLRENRAPPSLLYLYTEITQVFSGMIFECEIMGSRGLLCGRGGCDPLRQGCASPLPLRGVLKGARCDPLRQGCASPLPLRGVLKGARCDLERQEAEPPLSFFYLGNFDTRKNSNPISIDHSFEWSATSSVDMIIY